MLSIMNNNNNNTPKRYPDRNNAGPSAQRPAQSGTGRPFRVPSALPQTPRTQSRPDGYPPAASSVRPQNQAGNPPQSAAPVSGGHTGYPYADHARSTYADSHNVKRNPDALFTKIIWVSHSAP